MRCGYLKVFKFLYVLTFLSTSANATESGASCVILLSMKIIIELCAYYLFLVPIILMLVILLRNRDYSWSEKIILLLGSAILSYGLAKIANHFIIDARPFLRDGVVPMIKSSHDNGFPSDHTLISAWAGWLAFSLQKRYGVILLILAGMVGWSRVFAGVHHLSDVLGSFVIAAVGVWLAWLVVNRLVHSKMRSKESK